MFGKLRTLANELSNAVTLWGLVGTIGVSGILGIVGPTILQPILELPTGLRVALGICIFLVALAAILAGLKTTLERTSQGKVSEQRLVARRDLTPQSSNWSLWQELNRFRPENEQLKGALQQCAQSNGS